MTPHSSSTPPPSPWELHPVEAFLALLLISAAALLQLVANPPRPLRKRQALDRSHVLDSYSYSKTALAIGTPLYLTADNTLTSVRPSSAPAHVYSLTVAELRTITRQRGITTAGGRPIHKARRADLIAALKPNG